jgi:hypothetical protein
MKTLNVSLQAEVTHRYLRIKETTTKKEYIPNNLLFWGKILDLPHNKKCHEYEKKLMYVEFVNVQIIYYYLIMLQGL